MKTNYKKNPKMILGYLMAFAMVLFSVNLDAQCLSGIGANSESFEDSTVVLYGQGPWANWEYMLLPVLLLVLMAGERMIMVLPHLILDHLMVRRV
jgi:hypothetical protein